MGRFGESDYSSIRRMVVIKADAFSTYVPMVTYDGQGLLKRGLSKEDISSHAAVYMIGIMVHIDPREPILTDRRSTLST